MEFIDDLKIVWKFLSKYKREVYVIFMVAILASAIEAAVPYIYGKIVDLIIAGEAIPVIFMILLFWLFFEFYKRLGASVCYKRRGNYQREMRGGFGRFFK